MSKDLILKAAIEAGFDGYHDDDLLLKLTNFAEIVCREHETDCCNGDCNQGRDCPLRQR